MTELKRTLGFWTILSMAITSIIGTGVFFGAAIGAKYSGNLSLIAWALVTLLAVYIAACFGELAAMFPKAGGVYEFSKQTYSRFISFQIGWIGWLVTVATFALLSVAAIDYLTPPEFPIIYKILIAIGFLVILNAVTYFGMEASSVMINAFALITIVAIVSVLIPSFFHLNKSNFVPFITHPFTAVFLTLFFIIESFFGWEQVTNLAEETKNPEKVIPKALIFGTLIVALIGFLMAFVGLGMLGWQQLSQSSAPLADYAGIAYGDVGKVVIAMGIYLALIGSAAAGIISAPRLLMAMSRDKLFLPRFTKIHPRFHTPSSAIILQTVVGIVIVFLGYGRYELLLGILVPLALIVYVAVILSVPILRFRKPELKRPFKVPFGKIGPFVVVAFYVIVLVAWLRYSPDSWSTFLLALSLTFLSFPIYFLIEMYYDSKAINRVNDFFAPLAILTEKMFFPRKSREQALHLLGNIKGKKVLEFGCSVGTLTKDLVRETGPKGFVYATTGSLKEAKITSKRLKKRGYHNYKIVQHENQTMFVHPALPDVDAVISASTLSYVQDINKVLSGMNKKLEINDKIVFIEYDKYFGVIPNVEWVSDDEKIKNVFQRNGFNVSVLRKKGLLWESVYIYGVKHKNIR